MEARTLIFAALANVLQGFSLRETFKVEVVDNLPDEAEISFYRIGDEWWDLCAGPHLESTGKISPKAVALESVAGAYWRGDENREMLTRIYGTAWPEAWQLKEHKRRMEEAKKRDHRLLGKKLDLFSIQEQAGGGLCFWHPRGARVRGLMEQTWKDLLPQLEEIDTTPPAGAAPQEVN